MTIMVENIMRIPITDVKSVMLRCNNCNTAVETDIANLEKMGPSICPSCKAQWRRPDIDKNLIELSRSLTYLQKGAGGNPFEMAFVLPAPEVVPPIAK